MPSAAQLKAFAAKMDQRFGKTLLPPQPLARDVISTGSLTLDWALRHGGLESGAIYEWIGQPDTFKTSMAIRMLAIAQAQFPNRAVAYIDVEKTFRDKRATELGLDCSLTAKAAGRWFHPEPETSEDACDLAYAFAEDGYCSLIVIDSVGGMQTAKAFKVESGKSVVGQNAQIITRMSQRLPTLARQNNCTVLLINQPRANMSGFGGDLSAGPKALQHATTAKVTFSKMGGEGSEPKTVKFGDSTEPVSYRVKAKVGRMKNGAPGRTADFWFNIQPTAKWGPVGINVADECATMGIRMGVIPRTGAWYTVPGADKVNGRPAVAELLREHPELLDAVRQGVLNAQASEAAETTDPAEEDSDA